jgi:hypothetical protein
LSRNAGKTEYSVEQSESGAPVQASPDTLVFYQDCNVYIFAKKNLLTKNKQNES